LLVLDGATSCNVGLLRAEIVLGVLSIVLERRRDRARAAV
jgi:hypothetical protein